MTRIRVTVDDGGIPEAMLRLAVQFPEAIRKAYGFIGALWLGKVSDDIRGSKRTAPWERRPDGETLQSRTGEYLNSLFFDTVGGSRSLSAIRLVLGTRARSGKIHELGGEIRPVRSRFLAIPLEAAYGNRRDALSPGDFDDAFVLRTGEGNLLLARAADGGEDGEIEPLFLLRASVRMKPRTTLRARARELARSQATVDALRLAFQQTARRSA